MAHIVWKSRSQNKWQYFEAISPRSSASKKCSIPLIFLSKRDFFQFHSVLRENLEKHSL